MKSTNIFEYKDFDSVTKERVTFFTLLRFWFPEILELWEEVYVYRKWLFIRSIIAGNIFNEDNLNILNLEYIISSAKKKWYWSTLLFTLMNKEKVQKLIYFSDTSDWEEFLNKIRSTVESSGIIISDLKDLNINDFNINRIQLE